jgi:transposase-like protein
VAKDAQKHSERIEDKPGRRRFEPEYKLRILQEVDANRDKRGAIGEILRREGLYASQVAVWKRELEAQLAEGVKARKRGPKPDPTTPLKKEHDRLLRRNARLEEENRQMRLIIAAQKKIAEMFPDPTPAETEPEAERKSDA